MKISKIYTYPIKGIRAQEVDSAIVTKHGFPYDRRYMLLQNQEDGSYKNMAVAHFPEMTLYFPEINIPEDGDGLRGSITITYKPPNLEQRKMDIPLKPKTDGLEQIEVTMHRSPTTAYKMEQQYNDWFSSCFGFECILVYLGELRKVLMSTNSNRQTAPNNWLSSLTSRASELVMGNSSENSRITFADVAPYLIVSEKSMDDIHSRLPDSELYDITKFRPNIIVTGATEIWEEDYWGELTINGETKIECEHNCARCKSLNIDYSTGKPGTGEAGSMLKKLNSNRRVDPGMKWSPVFGRYSFLHHDSDGHTVSVGDEVVVSKKNDERTKFGSYRLQRFLSVIAMLSRRTDWEGLHTLK